MDAADLLDRAMFDDFAELFEPAELRSFIDQWYADVQIAAGAIVAAIGRDDRRAIGEIAHRTAGGGQALGAASLAGLCERLRFAAESGGEVTSADVECLRSVAEATRRAFVEAAG